MNKEIYFIWTQGENQIPSIMKQNIEFVRQQNLDYKITIYDIEKFIDFLKDKPTDLLDCFNKLNKKCHAVISDYIRIILLYYNGGVYMDIKTRPKQPLSTFLTEDKAYFFKHNIWEDYMTSFIASNRYNTLLRDMIIKMKYNINNYHSLNLQGNPKAKIINFLGPAVLTALIQNNNYKDIVLMNNALRLKYIQHTFIRNYHKYYESYHRFKEPLVIL